MDKYKLCRRSLHIINLLVYQELYQSTRVLGIVFILIETVWKLHRSCRSCRSCIEIHVRPVKSEGISPCISHPTCIISLGPSA